MPGKKNKKNCLSSSANIVLVGTYRPENRDWILRRKSYNLPIPACGKVAFHDRVTRIVLVADGFPTVAYAAKLKDVVNRDWLGANGYSVSGMASHGEQYALYELGETLDVENVLSDAASDVFVSSSRCPNVKIDASFYSKPYPKTGGKSMPRVFDTLRPYFTKERRAMTFNPVQLDFSLWFDQGETPMVLPEIHSEDCACVYESERGRLFTGDSLQWMMRIPAKSIDMVFADPPYSIGKAEWDCFASHEQYLSWCEKWVAEAARVLKDSGTCYICGFSEILADVKYRTQRFFSGCRWIVWHYKNKANLGNDWGRSHESILHFRKAKTTRINVDDIRIPYNAHTLKYPSHPQAATSAYGNGRGNQLTQWRPNVHGAKPKDVFDIPTTCNGMGEKTPHPTQKPEELVRKLVLASSHPGEVVLDPFSGSGTTAVVAQQLHRRWLACDRNAQYNEWAVSRLRNVSDHTVDYWIDLDRETIRRRESNR